MYRLILVTSDEQIHELIGLLMNGSDKNSQVEILRNPNASVLKDLSEARELLLMDVGQFNDQTGWIQVLKQRPTMNVLFQFPERSNSEVANLINCLEYHKVENNIEFIILGNYSTHLKLLLLREQFLKLLTK